MFKAFCLGGLVSDCILVVLSLSQGDVLSAGIFACCGYLFFIGYKGDDHAVR